MQPTRTLILLTCLLALCLAVLYSPAAASQQEDAAADAVAAAFATARQIGHMSKLQRIDKNAFRKQVCNRDMRFPSGLIENVTYKTSTPAQLPEEAKRLATKPDSGKTAARFGVGVCAINAGALGAETYSVVIATYESRGASFWRIFWE